MPLCQGISNNRGTSATVLESLSKDCLGKLVRNANNYKMSTATPTLSKNYTLNRPIRFTTSAALDALHPAELLWVARQWRDYQGGPEDSDHNVIYELITPITKTRVWVMDRSLEPETMLMLPSDY